MKHNDDFYYAIGQRIKEARINKKITQEELAVMVNLGSAQQISVIERGLGGMSLEKFAQFCKELDVDAEYLLFGNSSRETATPIGRYLSSMTSSQARCAEELIAVFAKALEASDN